MFANEKEIYNLQVHALSVIFNYSWIRYTVLDRVGWSLALFNGLVKKVIKI